MLLRVAMVMPEESASVLGCRAVLVNGAWENVRCTSAWSNWHAEKRTLGKPGAGVDDAFEPMFLLSVPVAQSRVDRGVSYACMS